MVIYILYVFQFTNFLVTAFPRYSILNFHTTISDLETFCESVYLCYYINQEIIQNSKSNAHSKLQEIKIRGTTSFNTMFFFKAMYQWIK